MCICWGWRAGWREGGICASEHAHVSKAVIAMHIGRWRRPKAMKGEWHLGYWLCIVLYKSPIQVITMTYQLLIWMLRWGKSLSSGWWRASVALAMFSWYLILSKPLNQASHLLGKFYRKLFPWNSGEKGVGSGEHAETGREAGTCDKKMSSRGKSP